MKPEEQPPSTLAYWRIGVMTAITVILLDQLSKWYASLILIKGRITVIPGYFDFELVHNLGAAFGLFANLQPLWRDLLLISVALIAILFVLVLLKKSCKIWETLGLGLVLGGAVGNLLDRVRIGWVVDFIHLHWHELSWPVFNVADSAISLGVALILWDSWRPTNGRPANGQSATPEKS